MFGLSIDFCSKLKIITVNCFQCPRVCAQRCACSAYFSSFFREPIYDLLFSRRLIYYQEEAALVKKVSMTFQTLNSGPSLGERGPRSHIGILERYIYIVDSANVDL